MMTHFRRAAGLGLGLAALSFIAATASADDALLRSRIEQRLEDSKLDPYVSVNVHAGQATLTGVVPTLEARQRAEKAAGKEAHAVDNQLQVSSGRPEKELIEDIRKAVLTYPNFTVFDDMQFELDGGAVRLQGSVRAPYRKSDIEARVARVPGITAIKNEIVVQPVSFFDDRLRAQLFRAIYASGRFPLYGIQANPPVRILVADGHVTLSGVVNSRVDQVTLGMIARQTLAFGVDNQLRLDHEPQEKAKPAPCNCIQI